MTRARPTKASLLADVRALRERVELAEASLKTHKHYVEARDRVMRDLERDLETVRRELAELKAHPLEVQLAPRRERLPRDRRSDTWHILIGDRKTGISPHIHVGYYPDGNRIGELFIELDDRAKATLSGAFADAAAQAFSVALQRGEPLENLALKWLGLHGGPAGAVWNVGEPPPVLSYEQAQVYVPPLMRDREIWSCTSLLDAIAKRLLVRFCKGYKPFAPKDIDNAADDAATEGSAQC